MSKLANHIALFCSHDKDWIKVNSVLGLDQNSDLFA
jgi:hypothetical protein